MDINQTKKGLHWGHGIILTFVFFAAFMAYFYVYMSQEKIELVGENYYADGQTYQKKINMQNQAIPPEHQISVQRIANDDFLLIQLPQDCESASVQFFRPSNATLDKKIEWESAQGKIWNMLTTFLVPGPWKRTITWQVNGKTYLQEDRIVSNKK